MQLRMAAPAFLCALLTTGARAGRPRHALAHGAPLAALEAGPLGLAGNSSLPEGLVPGASAAALRLEGEEPPVDQDDAEEPSGGAAKAKGLRDHLRDVAEKERRELSRLRRIHRELPRKLEKDFQALKTTFMPGYEGFTFRELGHNAALIAVGLGFIWLYVRHCYDPDRMDDTMLFSQPTEAAQTADGMEEEDANAEVEPDLIVVFHHPGHPYDDANRAMTPATLREVFVHRDDQSDGDDHHNRGGFRLTHLREVLGDSQAAAASARRRTLGEQIRQTFAKQREHSSDEPPEDSGSPHGEVTYGKGRIALLKDLFEDADRLGWKVKAFSSIDKDEIYVCMSLRSWPVAEKMLQQHRYSLQIQKSVVEALGIAQPAEEPESSPPYLHYDPRTLTGLAKNHVDSFGSGDRTKFYRVYYDIAGGTRGDIFNSKDRVRLMFKSISSELDLDTAEHAGLILGWYPAHNKRWTDELKKQWAGSHMWLDFSFKQPVAVLRNYYGSRVAYTMAWIGHFTKMLIPLTATAILLELVFLVTYLFMEPSAVKDARRKLIMGFSFVVVVWARVAGNLWNRQEEFLQELFDLDPSENQDQAIRPSFIGQLEQSKVDLNIKEKQSDQKRDAYARFCSGALTVFFCSVVFASIVSWIEFFSGNLGMLASAGLSLQIVCFSLLFEVLCRSMTEWENHKHQSSYYDSYLWKHCLLNMVNHYTAFFYLAIKQKVKAGSCPPTGCLDALQKQIMSTLCILTVAFIAKSIAEHFIVQFKIWQEERQARQLLGEGQQLAPLCWAEMQCKLPAFRLEKQVVNDVELVVALGFPILFASIAPAIAPFCLLFFATRLRMLGKVLTQLSRRPLPRRQFDTAAKASTIRGLMRAGVLFSATTLVLYNPVFDESGPLVKLSNVVVYIVLMEAVVGVVDLLVPKECMDVKVLVARRRYVEQEITRRSAARGDWDRSPSALRESRSARGLLWQTLAREEWDDVQPFPSASTPTG